MTGRDDDRRVAPWRRAARVPLPRDSKLFDYGAFTFDDGRTVLVSEKVQGTSQFEETLLRHHGRVLHSPVRAEHRPKPAFVEWHWSEVFKEEARPK